MVLEPKFARALPFSTDAFWVKDGTRRPFYQGGFDELVTNYGKALNTHFVVDGNWVLIDRAGTRVPAPNISSIRYFDPSDDKLMWARTDAGWGLIRPNGTWPAPPKFEQLGGFAGERAAVRLGGKWGYIDRAGTMVIAPMFEEARLFGGNDLAPVRVARRWGYIDRAGTIIVQPQYDDAGSFDSNGLATAKLDGLSGLIDKSGARVINPKFQKVWHDRKDVVFVQSDGKLGVYERSGRVIAGPQFSQTPTVCDDGWILGFADGRSRVARDEAKPLPLPHGQLLGVDCDSPLRLQDGGKFGFVDRALNPVTAIKFQNAYPFSEHAAVVKLDDKFGYVKNDGTWLIEPRFDDAKSFRGGAAIVMLGDKFGYVGADGTLLTAPKFDEAGSFERGFAIVTRDGKRGIVDASGTWLGDTPLPHLNLDLQKGLVAVQSAGKWGFVDASGAPVIEEKYDEVSPFSRGISWVRLGGSWCSIDRRGRSISNLPCQAVAPRPLLALQPWPY